MSSADREALTAAFEDFESTLHTLDTTVTTYQADGFRYLSDSLRADAVQVLQSMSDRAAERVRWLHETRGGRQQG